jgi:uncharacterized protein (DUF427 family)
MPQSAPGFTKHPGYQVTIEPLGQPVEVKVGDETIASSERAVAVSETRHRPVWYIPLEDIRQDRISPTDTKTYCPFKGHASYWSIDLGDHSIEDAIWAYLEPYEECAKLAGFASFYTNKVDLYIGGELMNKDGPGFTEG